MATLSQRTGCRTNFVLEFNTERLKPMNRVKSVVGEVMDKLRSALFVSAFNGGVVEGLN